MRAKMLALLVVYLLVSAFASFAGAQHPGIDIEVLIPKAMPVTLDYHRDESEPTIAKTIFVVEWLETKGRRWCRTVISSK